MKDYYLILGVPRSASTRGIRQAYRRLAKKHHPDRAGDGGAADFRQAAEAYEVLSDPGLRRRYNTYLREREARRAERPSRRAPARPRPAPEPLVPEAAPRGRVEPLIPEPGGFGDPRSRRFEDRPRRVVFVFDPRRLW